MHPHAWSPGEAWMGHEAGAGAEAAVRVAVIVDVGETASKLRLPPGNMCAESLGSLRLELVCARNDACSLPQRLPDRLLPGAYLAVRNAYRRLTVG